MVFLISRRDRVTTKKIKELKTNLKKNLQAKIAKEPEVAVFFFDESRFGTHSRIGHGWFPTGKRTAVKKKLGFKNFYVYTAVAPQTGEEFSLLAPGVNTDWMNHFLQEMSSGLKDRKAFLIMDQAGWHKAKNLQVPSNIQIIYLPPYSPELNPVERLWQHIKDNILKNKIYENLSLLEEAVCDFINSLSSRTLQSICNMSCYF